MSYSRQLQDATDAKMEIPEEVLSLRCWFVHKAYTNMYLMSGGMYVTCALKSKLCHRTAVCSPVFVGWLIFEWSSFLERLVSSSRLCARVLKSLSDSLLVMHDKTCNVCVQFQCAWGLRLAIGGFTKPPCSYKAYYYVICLCYQSRNVWGSQFDLEIFCASLD